MLKSKRNRRVSTLAKKRRKAESQRGLQLESLEDRRLLAVTDAFFDTSIASKVENDTSTGIGANLVVTVDTVSTGTETVFFTLLAPPATSAEAADFTVANFTLPAGIPAFTPTPFNIIDSGVLTIINDNFVEGPETVAIDIVNPSSGPDKLIHTIVDNESATVEVAETITEGTSALTVTLKTKGDAGANLEDPFTSVLQDKNTAGPATSPSEVTATVKQDYSFANQAANFGVGAANGATVTVSLPTVEDSLAEPLEPIDLTFTNGVTTPATIPDSYSPSYIGIARDTVKIADNEVVTVTFDRPTDMIDEDDPTGDTRVDAIMTITGVGTGPFVLQDTLTVPVVESGTARSLTNGAPGANIDYELFAPIPGTPLIYPANTGSKTVEYYIESESGASGKLDDSVLEGDETAILTFGTTGNIAVAGANPKFTLTIKDDEVGTIAVTKTNGDEDGLVPVTYTVTVTAPATGPGAPTSIAGTIAIPYTLSGTALNYIPNPPGAPIGPIDYDPLAATGPVSGLKINGGVLTLPMASCPPGGCTTPLTSSATLSIPVIQDTLVEPSETVILTLSGTSIPVTPNPITAFILDNETPSIAINTTAAAIPEVKVGGKVVDPGLPAAKQMGFENDDPATKNVAENTLRFNVELSDPSSEVVTAVINLDPSFVAGLTATQGIDFSSIFPKTVTFPAIAREALEKTANTKQQVTINILDELQVPLPFKIVELTEELVVEITSTTTPVPVGNPVGTPPVGIGYKNATQLDGRIDGGAPGTPLVGDQVGTRTLLIKETTFPNTAGSPSFIDEARVFLQSAPAFGGDPDAAEPTDNGNFTLVLLDPTGTTLVQSSVPVKGDVVVPAGIGGGGTACLTLPCAVTAPGGIGTTADYTITPGTTFTIPALNFFTPINVFVIDDIQAEATETVIRELAPGSTMPIIPPAYPGLPFGNPPVYPLPNIAQGNPGIDQTVNIADNDSIKVVVTAIDDKLFEDQPANKNGTGKFRLELRDASGNPITQTSPKTVSYTFKGTALFSQGVPLLNTQDYTATASVGGLITTKTGTLTIPAGQSSIDVTIDGLTDSLVESDETVILEVSGLGPKNSATVTICDDDSALITTGRVDALEDGIPNVNPATNELIGPGDGSFQFYLTNPSDTDTVITFTVMGGSANPASLTDFTVTGFPTYTGQVTIPKFTVGPGVGPTITFDGTQDAIVEGKESVKAVVVKNSGDPEVTPATPGDAFIIDDDGIFVGVMTMVEPAYEEQSTLPTPNGVINFSVTDILGNANPAVTVPLTANFAVAGTNVTAGDWSLEIVGQTPPGPITAYFGSTPGTTTFDPAAVGSSTSGGLTILPGTTSVNVAFKAKDDVIVEGSETATILLTSITSPFLVGAAINPLKPADTIDIIDNDKAEVFLTHQAIAGGLLPDENSFEEGCVSGFFSPVSPPGVMPSSGFAPQTGCVGTGPTDDNVVPIVIGLTQPSSTPTVVTFLAGGPGTSTADAEFEDFNVVMPSPVPGVGGTLLFPSGSAPGGLDPVSGLELYKVTIPAGQQTVTVELHAVNDNEISTGLASAGSKKPGSAIPGSGGVVEGTEKILTKLLPSGASSNPLYKNSSSTFQEITNIFETDVAVFSVTDHVLIEAGSASAIVTSLTDIEGEINVNYFTVDKAASGSKQPAGGVSATNGVDYTDNSSLFPAFVNTLAGANNVVDLGTPWIVNAIDDSVTEPTEFYDLVLSANHNNAGLTDTTDVGLVTILDDDVINVSASTMSIVEGTGSGTTKVTFTISLDETYHTVVPGSTITFTTSDGSAISTGLPAGVPGKTDYGPISGFDSTWNGSVFTSPNPDANALKVDVIISRDSVVEGDQTFDFTVSLTPPLVSVIPVPATTPPTTTTVPVQPVTKTITIEDDDTAAIRLVSVGADADKNKVVVAESAATAPVSILVDKAIEGTLKVGVVTSDDTATMNLFPPAGFDNDYLRTSTAATPLVFTNTPAGATLFAFSVPINDDRFVEGTELFNINVSDDYDPFDPDGAGPLDSVVTPPPAAFVNTGGKVEITDNDNAKIVVTRTTPYPSPSTLGAKFPETFGSITFQAELLAGTSTAPASTIGVQDTFSFDAVTVQGLLFGGQACGSASPTLPCPGGDFDFTTLSPGDLAVLFPESVDIDGDGDLEVPVGAKATFSVSLNDDNIIEIDEVFDVKLDPATFAGANAGDQAISIMPPTSHTITISDDDKNKGAVVEVRNPVNANEGNPTITTNGSFDVGLTLGLVTDVDINVTMLVGGNANDPSVAPVDYNILTGTVPTFSSTAPTLIVKIPSGSNSITLPVVPVADTINEQPFETVIPAIIPTGVIPSPARPGIGNAANSVEVKIIDDDGGTISPFVADVALSGAAWSVSNYSITAPGNTTSPLPWTNLDRLTATYAGAPTLSQLFATTLVLEGPTSGAFVSTVLTAVSTVAGTATFSTPTLDDGYYKATVNGVPTSFRVLQGDVVGDAFDSVFFNDFTALVTAFGSPASTTPTRTDLDGDGNVFFVDFSAVVTNFGDSLGATGFIPPAPIQSPAPALEAARMAARMTALDSIFAEADEEEQEEWVL